MALTIKKVGKAVTSTQIKNAQTGGIIETSADEGVPLPDGYGKLVSMEPLCEVGVDASYTHNLGNYQSAKVGVSLKIPCTHKEIDGIYTYAETWVNAKMDKLRKELEG